MRKSTLIRHQLRLAALDCVIKLLDECINNEDFKDFLYEVETQDINRVEEEIEHIEKCYRCDEEILQLVFQYIDEDLDVETILHNEMIMIRKHIEMLFNTQMDLVRKELESELQDR